MQIRIVQKENVSVNRKRFPVNQYYGPVSEMPDMNAGPAPDITVIPPENISNYEPDITLIIPDNPMTEMDLVSTYPAELILGSYAPIKCKECKIPWSPDGLDENGYCLYCNWGWNSHTVMT